MTAATPVRSLYGMHQTDLGAASTVEEALRLAGMDLTVEQVPLYRQQWRDHGPPQEKVEGRVLNVRSDTGQALSISSENYRPIDNARALGMAQALLDQRRGARVDAVER